MHTTDYRNGMDDGYRMGLQEGRRQANDKLKELQAQLARLQQAYEARKFFQYCNGYGGSPTRMSEVYHYSRYTVDAHGVVSGVVIGG